MLPFLLGRIKGCSLLIAALILSAGYYSAPIFDFSRLVSLFCHSSQSPFKQQLLSEAIQNEESQYKKIKFRNRNGINP